MTETRKKYDEEFKKRAVRMSFSNERTVTQFAERLGISSNMLYQWRKNTRRTAIKQIWHDVRTERHKNIC